MVAVSQMYLFGNEAKKNACHILSSINGYILKLLIIKYLMIKERYNYLTYDFRRKNTALKYLSNKSKIALSVNMFIVKNAFLCVFSAKV